MSHLLHCADREPASEIRMLAERLLIIVIPVEIGFDNQRYLKVGGDRVAVNRLVIGVVDVVNLDLILSEVVFVHTRLDSHRVLAYAGTVSVFDGGLWQRLCRNGVLVDELGGYITASSTVAVELTELFRAKLRHDLIFT